MEPCTVPTWLYHPTEEARVFETAEEVATALASGWSDTPIPRVASLPEDMAWMSVQELRQYAQDNLGMVAPPRIKLETLQARVAQALQEKG